MRKERRKMRRRGKGFNLNDDFLKGEFTW